MSRSADIWSLGCVFLEFLTWLVHGWKDTEFADKRMSQNLRPHMVEDTFFEMKPEGHNTIVQIHHGVVQVSTRPTKPHCIPYHPPPHTHTHTHSHSHSHTYIYIYPFYVRSH